ncbi:MAG TPA: hypothetical protein VEP48_10305 [Methylomirabilota bacterium]|nr:hypothetical protein [Methylomirabilota bacterium]
MNDRPILDDLEPDELQLHRLLAAAPPQALPVGFRDSIMARLRSRRVTWELIVALLFAVPSLAFLARQVLVHGEDFARAIGNIMTAASSETTDAFFFVDGLTVIALALLGVACAFAAHALLVSGTGNRTAAR